MNKGKKPLKAYQNAEFINGPDARALRILAEYLEPQARFAHHELEDTIVFFGSARLGETSSYYQAARQLASRLTRWSMGLAKGSRRFIITSGGGPGIMEAANRGATEAGGKSVGMGISLPMEQFDNDYITDGLCLHFHYFFMRKFWLVYLAKAVVIFPGGFGTLDELFECLTLVQTGKLRKPMPIILFGNDYWNEVLDFDALVRHGTISAGDLKLLHRTDSVDDAYDCITSRLAEHAVDNPGATL